MNRTTLVLAVLLGASLAAIIGLQTQAHATIRNFGPGYAANFGRYGIPAPGAPIKMTTTTGNDADSGALEPNQLYRLKCKASVWVDFGTTAATDAAVDDNPLDGTENWVFPTGGGGSAILHVSVLTQAAASVDCYLTKLY